MLLTRDTCSYYHNTKDGRYSRRSHLQWSEPIKVGSDSGQGTGVTMWDLIETAHAHSTRPLLTMADGY